jgi:hypothetical protein
MCALGRRCLTKGGHTHRVIGATILLYGRHLATKLVKRGTSFVHGLEVADSIMMKTRAAAVGLTTAATIAAVTVPMPGSAVAGPPIEHFIKAEPQVPYRPSIAPVERLSSAFNRTQPAALPAPAQRAPLTPSSAAIPK